MPRQVDYYFSLQSPWAYIGHKLFREVASTYDLKVYYRSVVLVDLRDRRPAADKASSGAAALPDGRAAALARQAWPEFSSSAGELAVQRPARRWRGDRGDRGWPRSRSISAAGMWEDQLNLADPAILVKMADDSGLPGKQLVERSESAEISTAYEQNRLDALAADVFGSPVYVLDGEVFWGQDRIELLADALKSGRAPYRSHA